MISDHVKRDGEFLLKKLEEDYSKLSSDFTQHTWPHFLLNLVNLR